MEKEYNSDWTVAICVVTTGGGSQVFCIAISTVIIINHVTAVVCSLVFTPHHEQSVLRCGHLLSLS